jgi:hypothetical protein
MCHVTSFVNGTSAVFIAKTLWISADPEYFLSYATTRTAFAGFGFLLSE